MAEFDANDPSFGAGLAPADDVNTPVVDPFSTNGRQTLELQTKTEEFYSKTAKGLMFMPAGAIDDIGRSIGLLDENSMQEFLGSTFGEGTEAYYAENKGGLRMAGGLVAGMGSLFMLSKFIRSGGYLDKALTKVPGGERLAPLLITSGQTRADRVAAMDKHWTHFKKAKGTDLMQDKQMLAAIRAQTSMARKDMAKEVILGDAMLYGLYSENEFFWPADDNIASSLLLYGGVNAAFIIGAGKFQKMAILKDIASFEKSAELANAINRNNLPVSKVFSRVGSRGLAITIDAATVNAARKDIAEASTQAEDVAKELRSNSSKRVDVHTQSIQEEVQKLSQDVWMGNDIDGNFNFSKTSGETRTVVDAAIAEPSIGVGLVSLNRLAPDTQKTIHSSIEKAKASADKQMSDLWLEIQKTDDLAKKESLQIEYNMLQEQADRLDSHGFVIEPNGALVPARLRQWSVFDEGKGALNLHHTGESAELGSANAAKIGMHVGVTNRGELVFSELLPEFASKSKENAVINGINVARVLNPMDVKHEMQHVAKMNAIDMTYSFAVEGRIGRDLFSGMPREFKNALHDWKGSSNAGPIRKWGDSNDPKLIALQDEFKKAGLHRRLYEVADDNGMIPMYRGESKKSDVTKVGSNVVSMTPNPKYADRHWGGSSSPKYKQTVRVNVHVEDIIGVIDVGKGSFHEFEFIVKGNKNRVDVNKITNSPMLSGQKVLNFQAQNFTQRMHVYGTMQGMLDKLKPLSETKGQIQIHSGKTFAEIDFALAAMRKYPDKKMVNFIHSENLQGADLEKELMFLSAQKKFNEYAKHMMMRFGEEAGVLKLKPEQLLSDYDMLKMLNLPQPTGAGHHPLIEFFNTLIPDMGETIPSLRSFVKSYDELVNEIGKYVQTGSLSEARQFKDDFTLSGDMLVPERDWEKKPVLAFYKDRPVHRVEGAEINAQVNQEVAHRMFMLENAESAGADLVAIYLSGLTANPAMLQDARGVEFLIEGTQASRGVLTQQQFANRNSEAMRAMYQIKDRADRQLLKYLTEDIFKAYGDTFTALSAKGNDGSLKALNININEYRNGWDLLPEPVEISPGKWALALDPKSKRNQEMYKKFFGKTLKDDAARYSDLDAVPMPVRQTGKADGSKLPTPAVMDEVALSGYKALTELSHKYLQNLNYIRSIRGLPAINKREWHIPFSDLSHEHKVYLVDPQTGKPEGYVFGRTEQEALRAAEKRQQFELAENQTEYSILTEDYVENHMLASGMEFERMSNFGWSGKQSGGIGQIAGDPVINLGKDVFHNTIKQLQNNFQQLGRYTSATVFESQLNHAAKMRASMPKAEERIDAKTTIYDKYIRTALSKPALTSDTKAGRAVYAFEDWVNEKLGRLWDKYRDVAPTALQGSESYTKAEYERLNKTLGEYNPFKSVNEMVEKTNKINLPPTFKSVAGPLMNFTTAMVLRIGDLGMPLINIASVAGVAPAVLKSLQRMPTETVDQWKRRISAVGSPISDTEAIPNTTRLAYTAMEGLWDADTKAAFKIANDRYGLIRQEVAEKIEFLTVPLDSPTGRFTHNTIKWLSKPTDWSEAYSRKLSFNMFYNIGRKTMKLDQESAITFAHRFASDVVGDYSTVNKPQIFQGAGMPFGLFTTWTWNFLQRVYGDVEGGRLGAAVMQAAMHQFLFGAEAQPGFGEYVEKFTTSYDGRTNILDKLDQHYGSEFTDDFLSGTIASLSGIAIQNRANITMPALFQGGTLEDLVPAYRTMSTLIKGLGQTYKDMKTAGQWDNQALLENISNYAVNGAIKNITKVAALGYEVDKKGNLMIADTRKPQEMIARFVELDSMEKHRTRRELNRDYIRREIQAEKRNLLGRSLKTLLRENPDTDQFSKRLGSIAQDYFRSGGDVEHFRNLVRQSAIKGLIDVRHRKLIEAVRRADDAGQIIRLLRE